MKEDKIIDLVSPDGQSFPFEVVENNDYLEVEK
jgi:hypothetical protein